MSFVRKALAFALLLSLPAGHMMGAAAVKKRPSKRHTTASSKSKSRQNWRTRQLQPSPERYKEIQQALAAKGYLAGQPTGIWNQESIDALRRFQQDQHLEASGKIDSLSLIALGLGPKRETPLAPAAAPASAPEAPQPRPSN